MTSQTPEQLAAACANLLRFDPPPTEAEINLVLDTIAGPLGVDQETTAATRKLLHARYDIRMERGQTLTADDEHLPWLDGRRGSIDPFYWTRYRELLLRSGWPPLVAGRLDQAADDLLDLLGNPVEATAWQRRGLVMGDVQSGKTASYAALICKAADAGYRMIILLTGTLENVRRQTQDRLDTAFIGFDSRDYLADAKARQKRLVGVGLIDRQRDGVVFTSRESDFRKNTATALNISLAAINEPVLVVTKKNKAVLSRLAAWLRSRNLDRDGKIDLPLLLIDDEADNASINTKKDPTESTAINKAIRELLGLFPRSSYVGFTATPFANIFIDPQSTNDMLGDDLFPHDFIHVLEPPTNYVGTQKLFPAVDVGDAATDTARVVSVDDPLRSINDADDWLPADHKKDAEPGPLPESLLVALRCFLLACAVRDLRAADGTPGKGGGIHRSMLVNVSRFTAVQNSVADALHVELDDIRKAVRLHGRLPPDRAVRQSPQIAALADAFTNEFASCGHAWPQVLDVLLEAIGPVRVQPVNQMTGAKSLDYSIADSPPGVRVIAVGGNSLSRGLTLEGLSTSYFLRNVRAYDTLLQMGRWFGYRDGYPDLCRLWLTEEAEGWYRHVADATTELKHDFSRMKRRKATPKEFGLRVRTHPGTLLITARNKMASGLTVDESWDVSLIGRMVESPRLYSDRRRNEDNLSLVDKFATDMRAAGLEPQESAHKGAILWGDVPALQVADFLDAFAIHPLNYDFQGDSIAAFLRDAGARSDPQLSRWTVAMPIDGKAKGDDGRPAKVALSALARTEIVAAKRKVRMNREDGSLSVSGKSARVGGLSDLRHAFSLAAFAGIPISSDKMTENDCRAVMEQPLLVIYLLKGFVPLPGGGEKIYREGLVLPALGLHFPGKRDPDAPKNLVQYRLNRVAQRELLPTDDDDDSAPDDADD